MGAKLIHGGELSDKTINIDLDYSVNLSPLGTPDAVKEKIEDSLFRVKNYPEYSNMTLKSSISQMWNVSPDMVLCTSGASEAFLAIAHALMPRRSVLAAPSFYGYEYCLNAVKSEIIYFDLSQCDEFSINEKIADLLTDDTEMVFLGYPNNPTGKTIDASVLKSILKRCHMTGTYLVLDISFCELSTAKSPDFSELISEFPRLIVVNSFTKTFAIPGVRAGYVICDRELADRISGHLPEWNLSVPAIEAACKCAEILKESKYLDNLRELITNERDYLTQELSDVGIKVYDSDTVFLLVQTKVPLYDRLIKEGILIRKCDNFRGLGSDFYRIAVKSHEENIRLVDAIHRIF